MRSTERRIQELKKRPKTPEVLNSLGDLYIRLGDAASAVACYYDAVDIIPVVQRDKRVALFKKIIMNAPNDPEAYEGLVDIYRRMGLFGEEKRYLHILDDIYTTGGYADRLEAVKQRLRAIENGSGARPSFRRSEKGPPQKPAEVVSSSSEPELPAPGGSLSEQQELEITRNNDIPEQTGTADESTDGIDDMSAGESPEVQGRAVVGLFSVELDEVREAAVPEVWERESATASPALPRFNLSDFPSTVRTLIGQAVNPYVIGIVIVLCIVIYVTFFFSGDDRMISPVKPVQAPEGRKEAPFRNIDGFTAGNLEISVTELAKTVVEQNGIDKIVDSEGIGDYRVVSVSVRAVRECLPVPFTENPHGMVSFLMTEGSQQKILNERQLSRFNRVIFKANHCDSDFAPVFVKFLLYYERDSRVKGISMDTLREGKPVNVFWN